VSITGILETALYVGELGAAEDFYERVLGLELESRAPGRHAFFRCGEAMLLIFDPASTSQSAGGVPAHGATGPGHVAFAVDDLDEWPARLRDAGIAIEADLDWPGGGRSLYVRDPAGNSVELTTPRIWLNP
jgi:catechol 2,3-dioxygenase-like lactoylglutathione lyase family enzyme